MNIIFKNIEVIAWFYDCVKVKPLRFKYNNCVYILNRILKFEKIVVKEHEYIKFYCISKTYERDILIELLYEKNTNAWVLYRM